LNLTASKSKSLEMKEEKKLNPKENKVDV